MSSALITGATAGIGKEFAVQLAARGDDLVLVARDAGRLEALAAQLRAEHQVDVEVLPADLSDREQLERVAQRVGDPAAPIDILVNNAGYGLARPFIDNEMEEEEKLFDVLCRAVLVLSHAAGRAMVARGRGTIINVSSVASFIASGTYSANKSFVTIFSESLAGQIGPMGVQVTALCPGFTRTEFHDRADMDMARLPGAAWLNVSDLVRECLEDAEAGRIISVPSKRYKALVGVLRVLPRRMVRPGGITSLHRKP